jgi:transcriptional regulator with XRE-family HTH domain/KaiC/GvpD/RAD55 family RecA-like ATPase
MGKSYPDCILMDGLFRTHVRFSLRFNFASSWRSDKDQAKLECKPELLVTFKMAKQKHIVSSGIRQLDQLLGGLFIGDNVVWYDDVGSLASLFSIHFIQESQKQNKPLVYVSFDRSTRTIIDDLGHLSESQHLTVLDCFTHGKGDGSDVFSQFYEKDGARWPHQVIMVKEPWKPEKVSESIYSLHATLRGDVRFVFESLTGMQDLWGGEEAILKYYTRSCPRLYELETIAYWIMEKDAHSDRLKAHINRVAQVAIDLSIKRGKTLLTVLKADKRKSDSIGLPQYFWSDDCDIVLDTGKHKVSQFDLGLRIKDLRTRQGLSQRELSSMIGVTPSTISQIESHSIYPSLPALFKIAETLNVEIGSLFPSVRDASSQVVFSGGGHKINSPDLQKASIRAYRLSPPDFEAKAEPYIIEIESGKSISSHFLRHKGEELGYVLTGEFEFNIGHTAHSARTGDVIYFTTQMPSRWKNIGSEVGRMLWVKIS